MRPQDWSHQPPAAGIYLGHRLAAEQRQESCAPRIVGIGWRTSAIGRISAARISEEEANLQKRFKELSDDYTGLAARYNRLAAVSAANRVQTRPAVDERQAMRLMLFQNFLQRAFPAPPNQVRVQTVDCAKFPALCVNH